MKRKTSAEEDVPNKKGSTFVKIEESIPIDPKCLRHRPKFEQAAFEILGKGSQGTVYATCVSMKDSKEKNCDDWVLKVIRPVEQDVDPWTHNGVMFTGIQPGETAGMRKRVEDEADMQRTAAEVGLAPDILDAWACNTKEGTYGLIVMQKVKNVVKTDDLDPRDLASPLGYLVRGLLALHAKGITHGDVLNNVNVLYTSDGDVWLVDYGRAREVDTKATRITLQKSGFPESNAVQSAKWLAAKGWIAPDQKMTYEERRDIFGACGQLWYRIYQWEQEQTETSDAAYKPQLKPPRTPLDHKQQQQKVESKQEQSSSSSNNASGMKLLPLL